MSVARDRGAVVRPPFWSVHTHSRYSANDAMPKPADLVQRAHELGYPALGLTDHGNVSGLVQHYKSCKKLGIKPGPGIELYVTPDREQRLQSNNHLTVMAFNETGYRNLVGLANLTARNFYYKPRVDFADLAELADEGKLAGLSVATGCYFGTVIQSLLKQGPEAAAQVVASLASWFPKAYVELQHHGIERQGEDLYDEDAIIDELVDIADTLGVPYIVTTDAHYVHPHEQEAHNALKELVAFGEDPSEATFPGDPYCLVDASDLEPRFPPEVLDNALANLADLAEAMEVRIPELDTFTMKVPDVTKTHDAFAELSVAFGEWLAGFTVGMRPAQAKQYREVGALELEIIKDSGMAGYLMFVRAVCQFMVEQDIWFYTRGSAASSLVNFGLGITQEDPLPWKLRFDRFLSRDRTKPPDIDLDVQDDRRDEVVAWLEGQFSVRQVGSHMQMGMDDETEEDDGKGSLLKKYYSRHFKVTGERITWDQVPPADRTLLRDLAVRKLISGPGTHAAGYIVAPDERTIAQLPMTWMTRGGLVTSYGKKDVEALGFVKLDLLGSKRLTALKHTCREISKTVPEDERHRWDTLPGFWNSVPRKDPEVFRTISNGDVAGVFQIEGKSQMYGYKAMKPRSIDDIVAGQALFRPVSLASKDDQRFIKRRARKEAIPERHGDIMAELEDTYGLAIYQEQVIGLMRRLGMTGDELTEMLGAVKASNESSVAAKLYLEEARERVQQLAVTRGWSTEDVDWLVGALAGYAEYSFNKSHAVVYGLVGYFTAWLKLHYPVENWLGMLVAFQGVKRGKRDVEKGYVSSARGDHVRILPVHVNSSGETYTLTPDRKGIRKGFISVKGIGSTTAKPLAENAPYTDLLDMGQRLPTKVGGAKDLALRKPPEKWVGAIKTLYEIDALAGLEYPPVEP